MPAYEMYPMRGDHGEYVAQEPVSPLSPRSEAILAQRNSAMQVSPLQSPTAPYPIPQGPKGRAGNYTLPPKAYVMPTRKVVGSRRSPNGGKVPEHTAIVSSPPARDSFQSRPRSHSFRPPSELVALPTGFLQDFTNHIPADPVQQQAHNMPQDISAGFQKDITVHAPADLVRQQVHSTRRPRSQTLPSHIVEADLEAYRQRTCAACGNLQGNSQQDFVHCKKCTNVYYCTVECWDKRVCHSRPSGPEKRCAKCGLGQSLTDKNVGKAVCLCSNRHVRATGQNSAAPPIQPTRTYHLGARSQQQRGQHLPKQTLQTSDRHAIDARVPESSRQNYRPVAVTPEKKGSWIDSKAFAVSVWIVIPLIILIVILGLVLGLKG